MMEGTLHWKDSVAANRGQECENVKQTGGWEEQKEVH